MRALRTASVLVIVLALLAPGVTAAADSAVVVQRHGGDDRIATAAAVALEAFDDGAETALLARADDFPDALAAAPLVGALQAPLLLARRDALPAVTQVALRRLGVRRVVLLGGPDALSRRVEDRLAASHRVERLAGADRVGTAAAVARRAAQTPLLDGRRTAVLVNGWRYPAALAAGPLACAHRLPILLTRPGGLPAQTRSVLADLRIERVLVVGGTAAVGARVARQLGEAGYEVLRTAGPDRTATAARLATTAVDRGWLAPGRVLLARGDAFPDGLTAASLGCAASAPLLLSVSPTVLGGAAEGALGSWWPRTMRLDVLGARAAVSPDVVARAAALASGEVGVVQRLRDDVSQLVALGPRVAGSAAERAAAELVRDRLRALDLDVELTSVPLPTGAVSTNVRTALPGGDGPSVLLAAHLDSVAGSPGADDNASGVAVLLELARRRVAGSSGAAPGDADVQLAFVGAEERLAGYGPDVHHAGSRQLARTMRRAGTLPDWMVSVDMVGVGDRLLAVTYRGRQPAAARLLRAAGEQEGVGVTVVDGGRHLRPRGVRPRRCARRDAVATGQPRLPRPRRPHGRAPPAAGGPGGARGVPRVGGGRGPERSAAERGTGRRERSAAQRGTGRLDSVASRPVREHAVGDRDRWG